VHGCCGRWPRSTVVTASLMIVIVTSLVAMFLGACSDPAVVTATRGVRLEPGVTYSADLDDDGTSEHILVDEQHRSLLLTDGDTCYRSRDKWQVVEAHLGDTDHDGLLEVVTLLTSERGNHIGLFAYFGGEYRERLVTSSLHPLPVSLEVRVGEDGGDVILVTEESADEQTKGTVIYRWNGFGFRVLDTPIE